MARSTGGRRRTDAVPAVGGSAVEDALTAFDRLRQLGISLSWKEVLTVLTDAAQNIARSVDYSQPIEKPHTLQLDLTPEEESALRDGGFNLDANPRVRDDALTRTLVQYAFLVATSLSVVEASQRLQVDESRIRQRLAAHTLYGIKTHHAWHLPLFQFDGSRVVPGIERVFPRLHEDLHPVEVFTWFVFPDPDLVLGLDTRSDEELPPPVSPRDWLRSGGNPEVVARLAESL
jgi:hypothetical protein